MDINQIAKMIEWLDEERRRDKATIARLEERLAQQQSVMDTLQKRVNGVESDQTVMKGQFVSSSEEQKLMENVRREVRQLLESTEARRLTAEREAERRHELNRENLTRSIRELSEKVGTFERSTTELGDMRNERGRFSDMINAIQQRLDDLSKKLEEPDRRLAFVEEQRRQDARRISEAETELPELRKSIDSIRPKLALIEELSIRNERRIQELHDSERNRRDQIQQFIDQQNLLLQQRDQQVRDLTERFGEHEGAMQKNMERFEAWSETHRVMKRIVEDFERIAERLERRINEVAEMQRLSEERFRQEWNAWRDDDQKRWKQYTLSTDDVWRNHDKEFGQFVKRMTELEEMLNPLQDSLNRLWSLERDRAQLYRERYQALLLEYDTGKGSAPRTIPPTAPNGSNT